MKLAIVGAHAFDAEVMAGALAARVIQEGGQVLLLHLTRGERGHPTTPPELYGLELQAQMAHAASILGAQQIWLGYKASKLPSLDRVAERLAEIWKEFQPHVVVTHWYGSWHPRHREAYEAVLRAREEYGASPILWFGENLEDLAGFKPSIYVEVGNYIDVWHQALACYELFHGIMVPSTTGMLASIPYQEYYRVSTRIRGLEAGLEHAQAFMEAPVIMEESVPLEMRIGRLGKN